MLTVSVCQLQGAYPKIVVDIILSHLDDDDGDDVGYPVSQIDPSSQDEPSIGPLPTADDIEVLGKTSAKTIIPNPIVTGVRRRTMAPAADRAKATPASGVL
jgi:hypothetical protein